VKRFLLCWSLLHLGLLGNEPLEPLLLALLLVLLERSLLLEVLLLLLLGGLLLPLLELLLLELLEMLLLDLLGLLLLEVFWLEGLGPGPGLGVQELAARRSPQVPAVRPEPTLPGAGASWARRRGPRGAQGGRGLVEGGHKCGRGALHVVGDLGVDGHEGLPVRLEHGLPGVLGQQGQHTLGGEVGGHKQGVGGREGPGGEVRLPGAEVLLVHPVEWHAGGRGRGARHHLRRGTGGQRGQLLHPLALGLLGEEGLVLTLHDLHVGGGGVGGGEEGGQGQGGGGGLGEGEHHPGLLGDHWSTYKLQGSYRGRGAS